MKLSEYPWIQRLVDWSMQHPAFAIPIGAISAVGIALAMLYRDRTAVFIADQIDGWLGPLLCNWYAGAFAAGLLIGGGGVFLITRPKSSDPEAPEEPSDAEIASSIQKHLVELRGQLSYFANPHQRSESGFSAMAKVRAKRRALEQFEFAGFIPVMDSEPLVRSKARALVGAIDLFLPFLNEGDLDGARHELDRFVKGPE